MVYKGHTLRRIKADIDIPLHGVKVGDLGGWIEWEYNLSHNGRSWVADEAKVYDRAMIRGNALVANNAKVFGRSRVDGNAKIRGNAEVSTRSIVSGHAQIYDNAKIKNSTVTYAAKVYGRTEIAHSFIDGKRLKI